MGRTFRCYCLECDWEMEVEGQDPSAAAMAGHGIATGHHETRREELE